MHKKEIISLIIVICTIIGVSVFVIDDNIILFDETGQNKTLNVTELENKTYEEIINELTFDNETLKERIQVFEIENLLVCNEGVYQFNELTVEIIKYSAYELCYFNFSTSNGTVDDFIYRIQKHKKLIEYIRNYNKLETITEKVEKVKETVTKEKEIKMNEFKENKVLNVKQMTGPNTYLVEVEETIEKYNRYENNPYFVNYYEKKVKLSPIEIIGILKEDVCGLYEEWEERISMELNPKNNEVYEKLKKECG